MPSRKAAAVVSHRKRQSVKRLLDGVVIPKISAGASTPVVIDLSTENSQSQSSNDVVTSSSSMLKRHEEVVIKKGHGTSPDPTLTSRASSTTLQVPGGQQTADENRQPVSANTEFFYSPMYRRYFALTPPNPRLYNVRLLEDYIDWYMNVYLEEEELPWQWISVGNAAERAKQSEGEAKEEADRLGAAAAATSSTSTEQP